MKKLKLDDIDRKILDFLIKNARTPFTEIAKKLDVSAGTIHVRVKKMEEIGVIKGTTMVLDYKKFGFNFIFYLSIFLESTLETKGVVEQLYEIPNVTVANIVTGRPGIICKVRAKDTQQARDIIFKIGGLKGVQNTEALVSLEESINDKTRLMESIFSKA